jgi:hypothetical protein
VQRERDEILGATSSDIRGFAELVAAVLKQENLCVVGNENAIRENAELFGSIEKLYA